MTDEPEFKWLTTGENDVAMVPATELEQAQTLAEFAHKLVSNMQDLSPEIAKAINENFWDLYEPF